jgi:hypothetical protein
VPGRRGVRGLRPAGDLRGCEEDGSRDGLDFEDDSVAGIRYRILWIVPLID